MRGTSIVLGLLLLPIPAIAAVSGHDPAADELADRVLAALDAGERGCGPDLRRGTPLPVLRCALVPRKLRGDLDTMTGMVDAALETAGVSASLGWRESGPWRKRTFDGPRPLSVWVGLEGGAVVVRYPARFSPCLDAELPLLEDGTHETISRPELVREERVLPSFPVEARVERVSGVVQLEAVVQRDGTVGEICIQHVDPDGYGFGEAAVAAVRQWRYRPAMRDGEPVDVRILVTTTFDLH